MSSTLQWLCSSNHVHGMDPKVGPQDHVQGRDVNPESQAPSMGTPLIMALKGYIYEHLACHVMGSTFMSTFHQVNCLSRTQMDMEMLGLLLQICQALQYHVHVA